MTKLNSVVEISVLTHEISEPYLIVEHVRAETPGAVVVVALEEVVGYVVRCLAEIVRVCAALHPIIAFGVV